MGKSHQNILEVLEIIDLYTEGGDPFFTVSDLNEYMKMSQYEYDISERTIRRIIKDIHAHGMLEYREYGNQTLYVVTDEELIPSFHKLYR